MIVCDTSNEAQLAKLSGGQVLTLNAEGTSSTTGRSKGAMLSHKNLPSNAQVLTDLWEIAAQDRLIHALPIFHTHGMFVAMNTSLLAGACVRFMAGFVLDDILVQIPNFTILMGVPTFYTRLLGDTGMTKELCAEMRLFASASAPPLAETHVAFESRTGQQILERYRMTETNMITSNPLNGERIAGTVGYAFTWTELEITDPDTCKPVPNGDVGMIEVRGDNVFQGYRNMPEKNRT